MGWDKVQEMKRGLFYYCKLKYAKPPLSDTLTPSLYL